MEKKLFLTFMLIFTCAFLWLISPFYSAILWAIAIAIIFHPVKNRIHNRFPASKSFAAGAALVVCCVVVIVPVTTIVTLTINEAQVLFDHFKVDDISANEYLDQVESKIPAVDHALSNVGLNIDELIEEIQNSLKTLAGILSESSWAFGKSTLGFFLNVGIMLYLAFFFLRDGRKITNVIFNALPIGDERETRLFNEFKEVTRATIKGNVVVASLQGLIGGITFWCLGISGAALWMFVMAVASLIPAIGAAIVWGPVVVYFFLTHDYLSAFILLGVGVVIISSIDNILRPILVGRDTKMPDYIIFISTIGGIALFGVNGFILGPIIASMFFVSWSIFVKEENRDNALFNKIDNY